MAGTKYVEEESTPSSGISDLANHAICGARYVTVHCTELLRHSHWMPGPSFTAGPARTGEQQKKHLPTTG